MKSELILMLSSNHKNYLQEIKEPKGAFFNIMAQANKASTNSGASEQR